MLVVRLARGGPAGTWHPCSFNFKRCVRPYPGKVLQGLTNVGFVVVHHASSTHSAPHHVRHIRYRDCELTSLTDHDLDMAVFSEDWDKVDIGRVW